MDTSMSQLVTLHFISLGVLGHTTLVRGHITLVLVREHGELLVVVLPLVLELMTLQTVDLRLVVVGLHLLQLVYQVS